MEDRGGSRRSVSWPSAAGRGRRGSVRRKPARVRSSRPNFDCLRSAPLSLALAELRLAPETAPLKLEDVLPKPAVNPVENDLSRNALPYATALAGACPWLAPSANVLPPGQRQSSSRAVFIPTVVLAASAPGGGRRLRLYANTPSGEYLKQMQRRDRAAGAQAQHATPTIDREIDQDARRARQLLDQFRTQTQHGPRSLMN